VLERFAPVEEGAAAAEGGKDAEVRRAALCAHSRVASAASCFKLQEVLRAAPGDNTAIEWARSSHAHEGNSTSYPHPTLHPTPPHPTTPTPKGRTPHRAAAQTHNLGRRQRRRGRRRRRRPRRAEAHEEATQGAAAGEDIGAEAGDEQAGCGGGVGRDGAGPALAGLPQGEGWVGWGWGWGRVVEGSGVGLVWVIQQLREGERPIEPPSLNHCQPTPDTPKQTTPPNPQACRNTVPVPRHWSQKRKYLQGKMGIEKPPFKLPEFIEATGISDMRQAYRWGLRGCAAVALGLGRGFSGFRVGGGSGGCWERMGLGRGEVRCVQFALFSNNKHPLYQRSPPHAHTHAHTQGEGGVQEDEAEAEGQDDGQDGQDGH